MLNANILKLLNDQIEREFYSSYLYLSMATYCHSLHLKGFGHWFFLQAEEERKHVTKILDYVLEQGGRVQFKEIAAPPTNFKSILDLFERTLAHEKEVTSQVHKIYEAAQKQKDHASAVMLQWFITEQVEEESTVSDVLEKLKIIPDRSASILYLDKELGKRKAD